MTQGSAAQRDLPAPMCSVVEIKYKRLRWPRVRKTQRLLITAAFLLLLSHQVLAFTSTAVRIKTDKRPRFLPTGGGCLGIGQLLHKIQNKELGTTQLYGARVRQRQSAGGSSSLSSNKKRSGNKGLVGQRAGARKTTIGSTDKAPQAANQNNSKKKSSPQQVTSNSKPAPPWQVLSTKEAKLNIEKEKKRREQARQGIQESTFTNDETKPKTLSTSFLNDADHRFLKWKRFNPVTAPNGMRFVGSYLDRRVPPSLGVPEVAFLGRSNVGKSSLLNRLVATASSRSSSEQARVGKTPGATASVNLYALTSAASSKKQQPQNAPAALINTRDLLGLVDLPGFGYAKLSKDVQESVQEAAEHYLAKRRELALGILLVDLRRTPPSDDDRAVLAALYDMGLPILVLATKIDKIKSSAQRAQNLQAIQKGLGLPEGQPLAVSSVTGEGIKPLWNIILEACETSVAEFLKAYQDKNDEHDGKHMSHSVTPEALDDSLNVYYDDDDDDLVYEQGYDWIHSEFYEDDDGGKNFRDQDNNGDSGSADYWDDEEEDSVNDTTTTGASITNKESWRSLKELARNMERRGEV
ncbi:hypothetical protein ACA910_000832 [Epithemia clementina (nom. ined.)]